MFQIANRRRVTSMGGLTNLRRLILAAGRQEHPGMFREVEDQMGAY